MPKPIKPPPPPEPEDDSLTLEIGPVGEGRESPSRESAIRAAVLKLLGRPDGLWRVAVTPLWNDHFRVNVVTGTDPASIAIPNSYFVTADGAGTILRSTPPILKQY
jgi:hypothetical protein